MENEKLLQTAVQLLEAYSKEAHTKTPAGYMTANPLHGSTGLFSVSGMEREILTAHVRPEGIGSTMRLLPSNSENPVFGSITGFTDVTGDEPDNACDDAPSGYMKGCNLTARFGMLRRDTNTIEITKVMRKINRGDFTDLILLGSVLGLTNLEPSGLNEGQILNILTMSEMVNVGVQTERALSRQIWQGTYGTGTEFAGLDSQIATGQVDAETGALCPAMDSDVKNYNYQLVGAGIVTYVATMEWYLRNNADKMGLSPVQWVLAMRPELWEELTALWPCAYHTNKCASQTETGSTVFLDGRDNTRERDAMRNGMYIDINGRRYPVVVDDGIFEHNSTNNAQLIPGQYASSLYFVPLTVRGGFPVTYRQYLDYRGAEPDRRLLRGLEDFFWTDSGVFTWALEQIKWCFKLSLMTEQRIILRAPQLAGRIDAIAYEPLQHLRSPYPDDPYFADGGVSIRPGLSSPTAVWA